MSNERSRDDVRAHVGYAVRGLRDGDRVVRLIGDAVTERNVVVRRRATQSSVRSQALWSKIVRPVFAEKDEVRAERRTKPIGEAAVEKEVDRGVQRHAAVGEVIVDEYLGRTSENGKERVKRQRDRLRNLTDGEDENYGN